MSTTVFFVVFLVCLLIGVPMVGAMGLSSLIYIILFMPNMSPIVIAQQMMSSINKYTLLAIPFFMIAGSLMENGGITRRLINFCKRLVGDFPGGLGLVCIVTSAIFAAMTGSGAACCAGVGSIMIPAMIREGYDEDYSCALQSASGIFGPLIPPSILAVLYACSTNLSVSDMLLAGLMPGLLMVLMVSIVHIYISKKRGYRSEKNEGGFKDLASATLDAFWALLAPVIILGGIYSGIFTPTEAAAVTCLYSIVVALFIYKEMNLKSLLSVMKGCMRTTASVMLIITTAQAFGWVLTREMIPQRVSEFFVAMTNSQPVFLLAVMLLIGFIGCFMDPVVAVVIIAPILAPAAATFGLNPIHFGVIVVVGLVCGLITPPVGANLYTTASVAKRPMHKFIPDLIPFIITAFVGYLIIIFVPTLSTMLVK